MVELVAIIKSTYMNNAPLDAANFSRLELLLLSFFSFLPPTWIVPPFVGAYTNARISEQSSTARLTPSPCTSGDVIDPGNFREGISMN